MTTPRRAGLGVSCAFCLAGVLSGGCAPDDAAAPGPGGAQAPAAALLPPPDPELLPVTMPDTGPMTEPVARQMRTHHAAVRVRLETASTEPEAEALGDAYGRLGMLLLAAAYVDAAEASLRNAQTLMPADGRWPYYLGRIHEANGDLEASARSYRRAVELRPEDLAARVLLGDVLFAGGELAAAAQTYGRALEGHPDAASPRVGLGRVALARREYAQAAEWFERALALAPWASGVHYPLALAYRGLGDTAKAETHLQRRGDVEALPPDPLRRQLDELLESANAYNVRGGRALDAGNHRAAADLFRRGLELAPDDPSLRQRLAVALFQSGDVSGAVQELERAVRGAPDHTRARFSLGVVLADQGRPREAIDHLSTVLQHDPAYVEARVRLADLLARGGRADEALAHYDRALALDPSRADAGFGAAMALIRLERYAAARDRLQAGLEANPENATVKHALARLLASAPDDAVRDGRRAMALVEELLARRQDFGVGETAAMALAEMGLYDQAAAVQRDVLAAAREAGFTDATQRMAGNLALYEAGRPCRTPFTAAELP